ncbi:hypothetical protein KUTeg_010676 [Tegillarca granosa]|uniref:Uncharacterized protein n=1 Tax=Tegillarca granosa TaxID=220873 RepID=A0ABQ9F544_TEGGR|nr:hypothetical protein KUTeg_010676 [Tegillarca granosa]
MCVHDFSENYYCFEKDEIQSNYFQKNEVSLHSGPEPRPQFFTKYAQLQVAEYLRSINYECSVMHEFTDGCPCHCGNCTEPDADSRNCENKWLGSTAVVCMVRDGSRNPVSVEEENEVEMRDLITPGCVVAVYTDDEDRKY